MNRRAHQIKTLGYRHAASLLHEHRRAALLWALVLINILGGIIVVSALVTRLDNDAAAHDLATAKGAVSATLHAQAESAFNTARWDDAVLHLYGRLDKQWAGANISGDYIAYIVDKHGRTLFSRRADGTIDPPLATAAPEALKAVLHKAPSNLTEAKKLENGYAFFDRYGGVPTLFGVMPIIPLQGKYSPPENDLRYLVYIDPLSPERLKQLGARFALQNLQLSTRTIGAAPLPLKNLEGAPVAALTWSAAHPGTAGLVAVSPVLILAMAAVVLLTIALNRLMRRQEERLAAKNIEYQHMADEAQTACEQAEKAQREADELRAIAEAAARAEAFERKRSAEALKAAARATGNDLRMDLSEIVADLSALAGRLDQSADATWAAMQSQEAHAGWVGQRSASAAASLDDVLAAAAELARAVQEISLEVGHTREAVAAAAHHSSGTAADSSDLLAHVGGIGCASEAIAKVAKQTRQLAVNAAIVAAHGESAHDGFSVIAREIKTLSSNSQASTAEIAERLKSVSDAVHNSVQATMGINSELQHIHVSISKADAAVQAHEAASEDVGISVRRARDEAHAVGKLIDEVISSIAEVRSSVQLTRDVSAQVRERIALLDQALGKAVSDLLAA